MKITRRSFFLAAGIIIGIIIITIILISARYIAITSRMEPEKSGQVNDSVYVIKEKYVNAYLFKVADGYIAFDACISENNVLKECKLLGIEPADVKVVFLTHCDGDHSGAVDLFDGADLYMHSDEEALAIGDIRRLGPVRYRWKHGEYIRLLDGDIIDVEGLIIETIHVPGHTPGSVCYIVNKDYLVSGDNLIFSNGSYDHFVEQVNMDTEKQIESLKRLPPPDSFKYILSAHHGVHIIKP